MRPLVTLLTDFGTRDTYVAELKAALLAIEPELRIVDVTHEVAPQAIDEAAWLLATCCRRFPPGSVHLAVVDPGVGGDRPAIAAEDELHRFVGPDNGVLARALDGHRPRVVDLEPERELSATFHGRDLFAPAAARLAQGDPLEALGRPRPEATLVTRTPARSADEAPVVHVDRFGNVVLDVLGAGLGPGWVLETPTGRVASWGRSYADVARGASLLLVGSSGYLELAVREGDAAARHALTVGRRCRLLPPGAITAT